MPLGPDHVQSAEVDDAIAELDVDAAAGHVGRDRDRLLLAGVLDDLGLALVLLGVQDVVRDPAPLHQLGEVLGGLDGDRADEDRLALLVALLDVVDHGRELASFVLKMKSFSSRRVTGTLVGISTTWRL